VEAYNLNAVELKNEAIWTANTELNFSAEGNMSSKISLQTTAHKVKAARLADFLNTKIDFLKIDIEGAEYEVIKDIQPKLCNVNNLFLEYHGMFTTNEQLVEILNILQKNNFNFYIKEAHPCYKEPFMQQHRSGPYDVQLNIYCFKKQFA